MGDRTFTAEDVLRIYELHLDEFEQRQVEEFFATEGGVEIDLGFLAGLLARLLNLSTLLASFLVTASISFLPTIFQEALRSANAALSETTEELGNIIEGGGVDA